MSRPRAVAIQPRLAVANVAESVRFYLDVLGFAPAGDEPTAADTFAILARDGVGLQLVQADEHHPAGRSTVWIEVADALAEHARVQPLAAIEWGPEVYWYGCREFALLDPDGHRIVFSSPTDEAPECREEG